VGIFFDADLFADNGAEQLIGIIHASTVFGQSSN
jgi:hypothetical protein